MYGLFGRWDYPLVLSNVHADCNFTSCGTPLVLLQCIAVNLNQDYKLNKLCVTTCILSRFRSRPSNTSWTNVQCVDCWVGSSPCSASWCMDQFLFLHPFSARRYSSLFFSTPIPPIYTALIEVWWCNGVFFMATSTWGFMVGESYLAAVWVILPSPFEPFWGTAIRITLIKASWCSDLINGVLWQLDKRKYLFVFASKETKWYFKYLMREAVENA